MSLSQAGKIVSINFYFYQILYTYVYLISAPVSSPRDVSATLITSTSFTLTWLPPIEDDVNGIITGYIVSVIVNETQESLVYNTTTTNLTISQLHPFYIHHCSVSCVTIASGPYSIPTDVQTLQDGIVNVYCLSTLFTFIIVLSYVS